MRRLVIMAAALALGCGSKSPSAPTPLAGGVLATFAVSGEQFKVWITNPIAIGRVLALRRGEAPAGFPSGRLLRGSGRAEHNAPYSWHLDADDIEIVDLAIELCDGRPSYVEANLAEYADRISRYCPWGARLVDLADYR